MKTTPSTPIARFSSKLAIALVASLALLAATPALASFHLMVIQEVFVGTPQDSANPSLTPDQRAQYVVLRMTSSGQTNLVATNSELVVEDEDGNFLGSWGKFTSNPSNGGLGCSYPICPAIIIGTQAAKNLFTIGFNQIVDGQAGRVAIPASGGRLCFVSGTSVVDCVAWGNFDCTRRGSCETPNSLPSGDFSANGCDTDFGTPAPALQYGKTLVHAPSFNCIAKDNLSNYSASFPHPVNNAGQTNNTDSDGDGLIDVLDCNDALTTILWPASEVTHETVTGKPTSTISWDSQASFAGSGVTYDVIRGHLASLSGFSDAACLSPNQAAASVSDGGAVPTPGTGFYFLERAGSGAGCVGTYGSAFPVGSRDGVLGAICP